MLSRSRSNSRDAGWTAVSSGRVPGEKRPVENGQFRVTGRIGNGDGKEAGVFVVHVGEFDALDTGRNSRAPRRFQWKRSIRDRQKRSVGHGLKMPRRSSSSAGAVPRT